jgi:hypothetical protein
MAADEEPEAGRRRIDFEGSAESDSFQVIGKRVVDNI